ncbi:hypothetical protein HMPREF3212_04625 [Citrobacter freundii]|nr:hypothetical protein HMPREF3212_04625 [Citrobacter freundii]
MRYISLQDAEIISLTFNVDNENGSRRMLEPDVCNSREIHET